MTATKNPPVESYQALDSGSKPSGCMRAAAVLLVVLFVVSLPLTLLVIDLNRVLFNAPLVKRVLTDEVVNSDLLPVVLEWYSERRAEERVASGEASTWVTEPDIVQLMSFLAKEDWRQIKSEALTNEMLTGWVGVTVDGFYAWIDSSDRLPQIVWEMEPFKARINTAHGVNCIIIAFNKLDACTDEQIEDFQARLVSMPAGTNVLYNLCNFPDPWHEDQFNDYVMSLSNVVANIPNQFELTKESGNLSDAQGAGPETLKSQLRMVRLLTSLAWVAPTLLALLVGLLIVRTVEDLGRWWGISFTAAGLLSLLPALTYRGLVTAVLSAGPLSEVPEEVRAEAVRISLRLAGEVFRPMLFQAAAFIVIGVVLLVIMFITHQRAAAEGMRAGEASG